MTGPKMFLVDVEATARSPHSGVMTEFGVVEFSTRAWFHGVLYPSMPSPENPAIPVLSGQGGPTIATGTVDVSVHDTKPLKAKDRTEVFVALNGWVRSFGVSRATMFSDNPGFDLAWMNYSSDEAGMENVFGHSARRIGDLAAGLKGNWRETSSWKRLRQTKHTHHPVDDAMGNAEALRTLLERAGQQF